MNANSRTNILNKTLEHLGGSYVTLVMVFVTLLGYLASALAALAINLNAEYSPEQFRAAVTITLISQLAGLASMVIVSNLTTRVARQRLAQWKNGTPLSAGTQEELQAWRQIVRLPIVYTITATGNSILLIVTPVLVYLYTVLGATRDQIIYTIFGGAVAAIAVVSISVTLIDQAMYPARRILLPVSFQYQISGVRGFSLLIKYILTIVSLIAISILLIAPIGYHQTIRVLYSEIGSIQVLSDLQVQSIGVSLIVLLIGLYLGWQSSRSISRPVQNLVDVFSDVERGNLKQRAQVLATDEVGELAVYFNRMIARLEELQTNLERQVAERTAQLEAVNEVGRVASSILDPNELVSRVVHLIADRFDYYYAAIFVLSPEGRWAELRDATGAAGETLKSRRHRLEIGSKSMVSTAIETKQARISLDVGQEAVRFNNPLLPETRSEIALPLMVGETVLGALDVQSTRESAFSEADIRTLQGMANQVAIALENARLFQTTQASLQEISSIQRQYLADAWSRKNSRDKTLEYMAEQPGASTRPASEYELPLALRDQIIGEIRLESDTELSPDERNWIEAIATQAALALENARLLEESQEQSSRDRMLSEITRRIWQTPTIPGILQTTIRELGRALNASEATIRIGSEPRRREQERT